MKSSPKPEKIIGPLIDRWLERSELRKIDLARAVRVSPATVTKWVRGSAYPTLPNLFLIAEAVGALEGGGPSLAAFFALPLQEAA